MFNGGLKAGIWALHTSSHRIQQKKKVTHMYNK